MNVFEKLDELTESAMSDLSEFRKGMSAGRTIVGVLYIVDFAGLILSLCKVGVTNDPLYALTAGIFGAILFAVGFATGAF